MSFCALTTHSLTQVSTLWNTAQQAQKDGYARDNEEAEIGVGCLGVRIHRRKEECIPLLQETAQRINLNTPATH
ncbi:IclR family transcriptional regulator C-terminal domain-containing protein [Acidithiobacillus sp. IBUN Pt1247-S3]|uniref:IclR family transcriptional regulator domain-containing protein n=1 Tax=Acidithiobacillus sp. IBUN Pt1247-S3 TaxID=3166642 RepID=UPI0034E5511D